MRDQQPKTPVTPALTRASAHHTGASGIAIPAPAQLLLAAAATGGTGAAAPEARAATPPPIQRTDILQGQPAATAPAHEIKPFRLQVNDNPPPSPQVQPWPMVQRRDNRPVVQMAPKRKRGAEENGGPPDRPPKGRQKSEIEEKEKENDRPRRELRRSPRLQKGKKQEGPPRKRQRRHERTDMEDTHRYSPAVDMLSEDGEGLAAQEERPPQPAGPLGIVTWNVAHFSKKKGKNAAREKGKEKESSVSSHREVGEQLTDIQQHVRRSLANWNQFSAEIAGFIAELAGEEEEDELGQGAQDAETQKKMQRTRQELAALLLEHDEATGEMRRFVEHDWQADALDAEFNIMDRGTQVRNIKAFRTFVNHYIINLELILGTLGDLEGPQRNKKTLGSSLRGRLEKLDRSLHSLNIVSHVSDMFACNEWLDIVLLQEVNDPGLLNKEDAPYDMTTGPQMISGGSQPQNEFYPILIRKESGFRVTNTFSIGTKGEETNMHQPEDDRTSKAPKVIHWNKSKKIFRPIIVYELERQTPGSDKKETVWVGAVHTTPRRSSGMAEFNRQNIFEEIEQALRVLYAKASHAGIPLIIGGDYYLGRESLVAKQNREGLRDLDPRMTKRQQMEDKKAVKEVNKSTQAQWGPLNKEMFKSQYPKLIKNWKSALKLWRERYKTKEAGDEAAADPRLQMEAIFKEWKVHSLVEFYQLVKQQRALFAEKHKHWKILEESRRKVQILRNVSRQTTRHMLKAMKLKTTYPISGTNPKANPLETWRNLQMADLFVGYGWQTRRAGILRPEGGAVSTDTEDLRHSRYWQPFSDHFPVAGIFSTAPPTNEAARAKLNEAFVQQDNAEEAALEININSFAHKYLRKQRLADGKLNKAARHIEEFEFDDRLGMAWEYLNRRLQKLKERFPQAPMSNDEKAKEEEEEKPEKGKEREGVSVELKHIQQLIEEIEGMEQRLVSMKALDKKKRLGAMKAGAIEAEGTDPQRTAGQEDAGAATLPVYKGTYGMSAWGPQTEHQAPDMEEEEEGGLDTGEPDPDPMGLAAKASDEEEEEEP